MPPTAASFRAILDFAERCAGVSIVIPIDEIGRNSQIQEPENLDAEVLFPVRTAG